MTQENQHFDYDVFISYSHRDEDWVHNQLLPRLKQARVGRRKMRVCIDTECFRPGAALLTEIERALLASRKTVLVLTPDYLKSEWTQFENILLQTSTYGDTSKYYRIDIINELYITNFKTEKQPAVYVVEIWRLNENFLIGSFTFETVK